MDALELLRLHVDWGADEAIAATPRDRLRTATAPVPVRTTNAAAPTEVASPAGAATSAATAVSRATAAAAAAHSLADLRTAIAEFTDCPLQSTAMHLVFADGNPAARIMLIGDAPGEAEDRSGRAFDGPGGRLLDRMLASIGLDRSQVLLTHALPWRPPGNRPPTLAERQMCLPFLQRQIALVHPDCLLLLGSLATASLLADGSLRRLRGRWQAVPIPGLAAPIPALPSFSPDQLLADPGSKKEAWADLLTLRVRRDAV